MANTKEWPAGILCVSFMDLTDAYIVRRPTTYQSLITSATSLFGSLFDEAAEELYVKTDDFGLGRPVQVLPDAWEEVQGFLKTVEFHTRARVEGPLQLDFAGEDGIQAPAPLSPSSTPPRDIPGRAIAPHTPVNQWVRAKQPADHEPTSVGYGGHSEDQEVGPSEYDESSRSVGSRVSLQSRSTNANPCPIRIIKTEPTNEEITQPLSHEAEVTTDTRIRVWVQYEDESVSATMTARRTFGSLFKGACNHFELDRASVRLFQTVAFDGRGSMNHIECNLSMSLGEGNVTNDDVFTLLPYGGDN